MSEPSIVLPGPVRAAALVVLVQGVGLVVVAIVVVVDIFEGGYASAGLAWSNAGIALAAAAGLVSIARGLTYLNKAVRTPLLVIELLCVPIGFDLIVEAGRWELGAPVLVTAVVVTGLLFTRAARACFERSLGPGGE